MELKFTGIRTKTYSYKGRFNLSINRGKRDKNRRIGCVGKQEILAKIHFLPCIFVPDFDTIFRKPVMSSHLLSPLVERKRKNPDAALAGGTGL